MKELQKSVEKSYVQLMQLREIMRITSTNKISIFRNDSNYANGNGICVWCRISLYIGHQYKDVPEDLRAYFVSPQQYGEYVQLCKDFIEGSLR